MLRLLAGWVFSLSSFISWGSLFLMLLLLSLMLLCAHVYSKVPYLGVCVSGVLKGSLLKKFGRKV
jgi:hypothetical protein